MRTQARVIALDGEIAEVLCDRESACAGCHKLQHGGDCSVCSLMSAGTSSMKTKAYNAVGASVGDVVAIESKTTRMLGYAALVFLIPLVAFFVGFGLCGALGLSEAYRYVGGAASFVLSFLVIRLYSEKGLKNKVDATVVEVIRQGTPDEK